MQVLLGPTGNTADANEAPPGFPTGQTFGDGATKREAPAPSFGGGPFGSKVREAQNPQSRNSQHPSASVFEKI